MSSSARIANDALNANTVGLLGANAIVMTLYYMLYDRPRWWNIIALPTLGILAATGSRKALVFVVVGTVLLFCILKSLRSANVVNSIVKIIGSLLASYVVRYCSFTIAYVFQEVLGPYVEYGGCLFWYWWRFINYYPVWLWLILDGIYFINPL